MTTKPDRRAILAATPLSALTAAMPDPLLACSVCGASVDPSDLPLTVWREHDEHDRPIDGIAAIVFLGQGRDHAACRKRLEGHPRLYSEVSAMPGYFPGLCGPCVHRERLACTHHDLKANGGAGLAVTLDAPRMIICTRNSGCHLPVHHARSCAGLRLELANVVPLRSDTTDTETTR